MFDEILPGLHVLPVEETREAPYGMVRLCIPFRFQRQEYLRRIPLAYIDSMNVATLSIMSYAINLAKCVFKYTSLIRLYG